MSSHITETCNDVFKKLYALKILKDKGLNNDCLQQIFQAKCVSKLTYASPSWWGFANASDINRINAIFRKAIKWGYYKKEGADFEHLCKNKDITLFKAVLSNSNHVLNQFLPPKKETKYSLKGKGHGRTLPSFKTNTLSKTFFYRLLYQNIY